MSFFQFEYGLKGSIIAAALVVDKPGESQRYVSFPR